jgi:RHS repeat-associated protein
LRTVTGWAAEDLAERYRKFMVTYFNGKANANSCNNNGIIFDAEIDIKPMHGLYREVLKGNERDQLYYFNANHLGSGSLITDLSGNTYQTLAYAPFGETLVNEFSGDYDEAYKFGGYERDQESGLDYMGARYRNVEATIPLSPDRFWFKTPQLSPYNFAANNPISYIDVNGDSIGVNQTITNDFVLNKAFDLFANSTEGRKFLSNYAAKGQTIAGHTFSKNGKYHNKGINLEYTTFLDNRIGSDRGKTSKSENGTITVSVNSSQRVDAADGNVYDWGKKYPTSSMTANQMIFGILSKNMTFFHESFIHVDLYTQDFLDDRLFNYSNIPKHVIDYLNRYMSGSDAIAHYQHYLVNGSYNTSKLWPAAALRGIMEVNGKFGNKYTNETLKRIMWNYNGGR